MNDFVQLWVYLSTTPLFGLTATLVTYVLAATVYDRLNRAPWANPVLWSVICIGGVLLATATPYPTYFAGAQFVHVLLGPAVVALGWPLWQRRSEVKKRWLAITCAALIGGIAAGGSAVAMAWALDMPSEVVRSLASKSVTAPVAMGIAERVGGVPALAAVFAVLTGLVGAMSGKYVFDALGSSRGRRADSRWVPQHTASALRERCKFMLMRAHTVASRLACKCCCQRS